MTQHILLIAHDIAADYADHGVGKFAHDPLCVLAIYYRRRCYHIPAQLDIYHVHEGGHASSVGAYVFSRLQVVLSTYPRACLLHQRTIGKVVRQSRRLTGRIILFQSCSPSCSRKGRRRRSRMLTSTSHADYPYSRGLMDCFPSGNCSTAS